MVLGRAPPQKMETWLDYKEIISVVIVTAATGLWMLLRGWFQVQWDRKAIERWLTLKTHDEPGESHVNVPELSKRLGLSDNRINKAIAKSQIILRSKNDVNQISIWRQEPQSIYEKRGVRRI